MKISSFRDVGEPNSHEPSPQRGQRQGAGLRGWGRLVWGSVLGGNPRVKVLVKSAVSPYSGYGQDGIGLCKALLNWGADVYLQPPHVSAPLPPEIAMLLTKRLEAPFDLAIVHQDPLQIECSKALASAAKVTVGWTMWEWDRLFNTWQKEIEFKRNFEGFGALIAYDANTANAMAEHTDNQILTLQGGYEPGDYPPMHRKWDGPFRFCMQGALHARKGTFYSIEAFKELKDEYPEEFADAELHLKTVDPGLHPAMEQWCPGLKIYHEVWTHEKLLSFYRDMHVMLCPSLGEGKNLPALQFLSTGGPVIATNWGGHTGWLSDQYAYPLNYELELNKDYGASQAKPDKAHLKELMLRVYRNRGEAREKGTQGARTIPLMCSWDSILPRLFDLLANNHPLGQDLKATALRCKLPDDSEVLEKRKTFLMGSTL